MRGKRKNSLKNNNKKRDKKREIEKPKSKTAAKKENCDFFGFFCVVFFQFCDVEDDGNQKKEKNKRESLDTIQVDQGLHLTDRFRDVIVVRVVDLDRLDPR